MTHPLSILACDIAKGICLQDDGVPSVAAGSNRLQTILSLGIGILSAICLLFVVIGGLRYVLSGGDPNNVGRAKGTVLFALIGLLITLLAQTIVWFVLGRV